MNTSFIEKWANALDEYKQGEGHLKIVEANRTRHCCLGVACELYQKETGKGEWEDSMCPTFTVDGEGSNTRLPFSVTAHIFGPVKYLGLAMCGNLLCKDGSSYVWHGKETAIKSALDTINDTGAKFPEIKSMLINLIRDVEERGVTIV